MFFQKSLWNAEFSSHTVTPIHATYPAHNLYNEQKCLDAE
jgi:hypothetical protein